MKFLHATVDNVLVRSAENGLSSGEWYIDASFEVHPDIKSDTKATMMFEGGRGGTLGHLGLLLTAAEYATVSNTLFARPANPGLPANIPQGATAAQIGYLVQTHQVLKHTYDTYANVKMH